MSVRWLQPQCLSKGMVVRLRVVEVAQLVLFKEGVGKKELEDLCLQEVEEIREVEAHWVVRELFK